MARLLAAGVLADYFEQVMIRDHDRLPDQPGFRPAVLQVRHLHAAK